MVVAGVDEPFAFGQFALEIENVARTSRAKDDAPEAGVGGIGIAVLGAQPNERVFARQDRPVGICDAHACGPPGGS